VTSAAETGVQSSIGVIPRNRELLNAANSCVAHDNGFSITLRCHTLAFSISVTAEIGRNFASAIETRVQITTRIKAGQRALFFVLVSAVTGNDDSPVAMHGHAVAKVLSAEVGSRFAGSVKCRIETPICVVADDRKIVVVSVDERVACDDNLSVALHRHTVCIAILGNGSCYFSGVTEARVEVAVRAVP
jgi:hypothetical protein